MVSIGSRQSRHYISVPLALALLVGATLVAPGLVPTSAAPGEHGNGKNGDRCADAWQPGLGRACRIAPGLYEVFGHDGESLGTTHGPDHETDLAPDTASALSSRPPVCVQDASDPHHIVIYARASDDADRYTELAPQLRSLVHQANAFVFNAADQHGGVRDLKMHCTAGQVTVLDEVLPTPKADAAFSTIVSDLRAMGYTSKTIKYWVWYDDSTACSCSGTGHVYYDDRPTADNRNNGHPYAAPMFAVTFGVLSVRTILHEASHTMGAVQHGAPHSSGAGHCNDGRDIMCYGDGGPSSSYTSGVCGTQVYDCGSDDYFHPAPPEGSWLATHWNLGSSVNRFVAAGSANAAPTMASLDCAPAPSAIGETVTCTFHATDDSTGVAYDVDWGDGTTTRVPTSGHVAPGIPQEAAHAWTSAGTFQVAVSASDDDGPPRASTTLEHAQSVATQNAAPIMASLDCAPSTSTVDETVTCTFHATDDSTGVSYTITWGDGSTSRVPTSGTVAPGAVQTAAHAWTAAGGYTVVVRAKDDDATPTTSAGRAVTQTVEAQQSPPTMDAITCTPSTSQVGATVQCTATGHDPDGDALTYRIDWGDGTSTPTAQGDEGTATHAWQSAGSYTVTATANDGSTASAPAATTQAVTAPRSDPTITDVSCAPSPSDVGQNVQCTMTAHDPDDDALAYTIDWGDDTTTTIAGGGTSADGDQATAEHVWQTKGTYTITVHASDGMGTSAPASEEHKVRGPNGAPVLRTLWCTANRVVTGESLTCKVKASDDSAGIAYTVIWGDGTTTRLPVDGYLAPEAEATATHAWANTGSYTIIARVVDEEGARGAARAIGVNVEPGCSLEIRGSLSQGMGGGMVMGTSAADHDVPGACRGAAFMLSSPDAASNFDVCWYEAWGRRLSCSTGAGDEQGTVPQKAARARVIYHTGSGAEYVLRLG